METIKGSLAFTGKLAFLVISRVIGFTVFGTALNLALLALLMPEIMSMSGGGGTAARTGIGAVLVPVQAFISHSVPMVLVGALLFSPFFYFVLGKRYGLMLALNVVMRDKKEQWVNAFTEKIVVALAQQSGVVPSVSSLQHLLNRLSEQRWPQSWIIQYLIKKLNLAKILKEVASRKEGSLTDRSAFISTIISRMLDERIGQPGLSWFYLLLATNVSSAAAFKILY